MNGTFSGLSGFVYYANFEFGKINFGQWIKSFSVLTCRKVNGFKGYSTNKGRIRS